MSKYFIRIGNAEKPMFESGYSDTIEALDDWWQTEIVKPCYIGGTDTTRQGGMSLKNRQGTKSFLPVNVIINNVATIVEKKKPDPTPMPL